MKRIVAVMVLVAGMVWSAAAKEFERVPRAWKWLSDREAIFSFDGSFADSAAFVVDARTGARRSGVSAPAKYSDFPVKPEGGVNLTYSPDSTKIAFTRNNDLYVVDIASGVETRLTFDGTELILNGYASWVYYEEILGRSSNYRAFWWSPDSKKIGFYRFDNTQVPVFPIYSAYGKDYAGHISYPLPSPPGSPSPKVTNLGLGGSLSETRYPKCGQTNPQVRIGIVNFEGESVSDAQDDRLGNHDLAICWADFDETEDQYFGIPFWGPDSKEFFIARMPRLQNTIDLYAVNVENGSKRDVYHETYKTWLKWFNGVKFTEKGLYMAREFETGWQQIYFLSYDGSQFRRLTSGTNWSVSLVRIDEKKGDVYFTAKRDASVRQALYKVDAKGVITALTDPAYNVTGVSFSPDGKHFVASYSNVTTPTKVAVFQNSGGIPSAGHGGDIEKGNLSGPVVQKLKAGRYGLKGMIVADAAGSDYDSSKYALGHLVHMKVEDGFVLPGMIVYPKDFDPNKKYPVHVDIYGGPDTPVVRDRWTAPNANNQWWSQNGIIQIWVDPRAGGHNGREGLDMIYRQLTVNEVKDFIAWGEWLQALPYVKADKIGVEGFSFGGTMTSLLVMRASDKFHYGIAGGGVYDWALYDSHYTERYMDTPANNPEGYEVSKVLNYVSEYPVGYGSRSSRSSSCEPGVLDNDGFQNGDNVMLKLTHGTGDDNVHHQNTLLLVDELHKAQKKFELMIYPDGMHGYYDYQGRHFLSANRDFWLQYLF